MTVDFGKMAIHHLYKITDVTFYPKLGTLSTLHTDF